jgi:23S rRNA G2445 N2-methylase RlmL
MNPIYTIELESPTGLEDIVSDELQERFSARLIGTPIVGRASVRANYQGNLGGLLSLRTPIAAYLVEHYPIPRPKGFLGHQYLTQLANQIQTVRMLSAPDAYTTIHVAAAGSDSSVMLRLREELVQASKLTDNAEEGDLWLRLRPTADKSAWEALARLSPRPNVTRAWRVVNWPGALNAAVAAAMVRLSNPTEDDVVLNLMAGSGTLAIERLLHSPAARMIACDTDPEARAAATTNLAAAKLTDAVELTDWDATDLSLDSSSVTTLLADFPFGNLVGSHRTNVKLYPKVLQEAGRVARAGTRFVMISHEVKLMEELLAESPKWRLIEARKVSLNGLQPRVYVLARK